MANGRLNWQSRLIEALVLAASAAAGVVLARHFWSGFPRFVIGTFVLGVALALAVVRLRAGSRGAAGMGLAIVCALIFSTSEPPYLLWRTAMVPVGLLFLLTSAATRLGRARKERLGLAEGRQGRRAAQVAANLGMAALLAGGLVLIRASAGGGGAFAAISGGLLALPLAALAEAAADTVSSELGLALGGQPRLITSFRRVEAGVDGGLTAVGTLAGLAAAALVAASGAWALRGDARLWGLSFAGGAFGLFFDSFLGATAERRGWLNNDAVNFLSTASAAAVAALLLAF